MTAIGSWTTRYFARLMATAVAMLGFIAVTNHWANWQESIQKYQSSDQINYGAMAAAAPGLANPSVLHRRIVEWHAERWAVQWVVGSVAKLFSMSVFHSYRLWLALVTLAIALVLTEIMVRIHVSLAAAIVCAGVWILNAYSLRGYIIAPGEIADLVFVLGSGIAVIGLVVRSPATLLGGLVLATIARQTALPAALVAAAAVWFDPAWRERLGNRRPAVAVAAIALPVVTYVIIRAVASPFAGPDPSIDTVTILGSTASLSAMAQHFGRCVNGLLAIGALLVGVWWLRRGGLRAAPGRKSVSSPVADAAIYACLGFGLAIALQPMSLNPTWVAYNEPRLAVMGLIPLIAALALMIRELERARATTMSAPLAAAIVGLLALGSFHHIYTVIGTSSKGQTVVLQAVTAVAALFVLQRAIRPGPLAEGKPAAASVN